MKDKLNKGVSQENKRSFPISLIDKCFTEPSLWSMTGNNGGNNGVICAKRVERGHHNIDG
jgi:hypothetical protein